MAQTLSGSISEMSLLEILKLINSGQMNGRLVVTNSVSHGEIYVESGQIIHCVSDASIGEVAFSNMLGWIEGKFSFENDIQAPETSIVNSTEQLLLEGTRMIKDWKEIKKVITSMDLIFSLSSGGSMGVVNLQPEEWQVLAHVNGNRTIMEIVDETGKDEFEIARILFRLHSAGLLQKTGKQAKAVHAVIDVSFFKKIEKELTNVIGPLAPVIIDEAIELLGETRSNFPQNKIAALVENVSQEIQDETRRLKFSQIMLASLNKY
ncbi:DUF4388 domain-containing protein [candidate division KSB1 bacterium]|nr:DUF4388 domain-containing protein [candidate division KSB1 bacterium]